MIEEIRQALINSDMSPRDLRIALDIIARIEREYKDKDVTIVYGPPEKKWYTLSYEMSNINDEKGKNCNE